MTIKVNDSERLKYSLMGTGDADLLFELDQDIEVMRYINGGKITSMQEVHDVFLPRMMQYTDASKGWGLWKVNVMASDQFIGWILVRPMDFFTDAPKLDDIELGWRFKRESWGKGYATEAANQVMQALIEQQNISQFSATVMPDNVASIGIMKKLGMKYHKTALHKDPLGDEVVAYYSTDV